MRLLPAIITILFGVLPLFCLFGQNYTYRQFTSKDGLGQMQVQCLFQDSNGYLWMGTKTGASKFNGERFENFSKSDGLLSTSTYQIAEDSTGNIWFCHANGLSKYDGKTITTFANGESSRLYAAYTYEGDKIFLYYKKGKYVFEDGKFKKLTIPAPHKGIAYSPFYQGFIAAIDSIGLCLVRNDSLVPLTPPIPKYNRTALHYHPVLKKIEFHCRASKNDNTEVFLLKNGTWKKTWELDAQTHKKVNINYEAIPHSFYYMHNRKELMYLDKENKQISSIQKFDFDYIQQVLQDNQNNVWIASEEGLIQFFGKGFQHFNSEPFTYVWSIVEDDEGKMWLAGYHKELQVFDGEKIMDTYSFSDNTYYFRALKDKKGNLIFPMGSGIAKREQNNFEILDVSELPHPANLTLYEDQERDLLLAGVYHGVKFIKDYKETAYYSSEKDGIHDCPFIVSIEKDTTDNYWLGSFRGLSQFDYTTKTVRNYTRQNNKLPADGVISAFCDYKGTLWLGCWQSGLARYDYDADSIIMVENARLNPAVNFIQPIDTTHLLLGAIDGLYVLDLQQYYQNGQVHFKHFNHRNGYLGLEPTQNTAMTDSKGYIWVASATSVDKINPQQLNLNVYPLKTVITKVNQQKHAFNTTSITLPKGKNSVEYRFEAVGLDRPLQTQYAYKLEKEGEQSEWSDWRVDDFAVYSKLASGNYVFSVKSRQGSSVSDSLSVASLPLVVELNWWEEPDFFKTAFALLGIFFGLLIVSGIGLFWLRSTARRRQKEIEEQTHKSQYLQVQTSLAQMNPHFIFNVLQSMQGLIITKDWQRADDYLVQLSKLIRRFLEASISSDWATAQANHESFTLEQEIELLHAYIKLEQQLPRNSFEYQIDHHGIDIANYDIPPMLLQPFVENAIKHGLSYKKEGEKNLRINFVLNEEEELLCTIEDTGVGRAAASTIQQESFQAFQSQGTKLVEKRVQLLNESGYHIQIEIKDRTGGGTIVNLKIAGYYDY